MQHWSFWIRGDLKSGRLSFVMLCTGETTRRSRLDVWWPDSFPQDPLIPTKPVLQSLGLTFWTYELELCKVYCMYNLRCKITVLQASPGRSRAVVMCVWGRGFLSPLSTPQRSMASPGEGVGMAGGATEAQSGSLGGHSMLTLALIVMALSALLWSAATQWQWVLVFIVFRSVRWFL